MSFILDALRKSEGERQREAGPALSRVPLAVAEQAVPGWIWVVMGTLGAAIVALSGLWWQTARSTDDTARSAFAATTGPSTVETRPLALPQRSGLPPNPASRAASPSGVADAGPGGPSPARGDAPNEPVTSTNVGPSNGAVDADAAAPPARVETERSVAPPAPARPSVAANLRAYRSVPELMAAGFSIPSLVLEIHVFDPDPAKRSVFFSGSRYREGERIKDGPQIIEITPEGVVLDQNGRQALLRP